MLCQGIEMTETLVALAIFFTTVFTNTHNGNDRTKIENDSTQKWYDKPQCEVVK